MSNDFGDLYCNGVIQVFSPLLGKDLKLSAEEIEIGLIKPNASLAQLHIKLLKVPLFKCVFFAYVCVLRFG